MVRLRIELKWTLHVTGLPSWLLHDPHMVVRTSKYKPYLQHVENYFSKLLPILAAFQYSKGNGPIIAFQIENEYGSYDRYVNRLHHVKRSLMA